MTDLLRGFWYVALSAAQLARGGMQPVTLLGQEVLLGRTNEGAVFALKDFCPHRGIPLRYGKFDGCAVECCYHGWRFNPQGTCIAVPSLMEDDPTDISRIRTPNFPCAERDGLIWVYVGGAETPPEVPDMQTGPGGFYHVESVEMPCNIDHAVIGLMDPAHGPFVHQSWWWRSKRSIHAKQKKFEPRPFGFAMASHAPSSNSRAYRILGAEERTTEISFQLPALRTERITIGRHRVVLLTALTPKDANHTVLHQFMYTTVPLLNWLRPLLKPFGKSFIAQDVKVVKMQQEGLRASTTPLMLLGDADAQARWYFRLKKEWIESQERGVAFTNPLKERTLRWRS